MRPGGQLPWLCCSRVARVQRLVKLDCDRPRSRQGPRPGGPTTAMTRTADACQQASTSARSSRRFSSTGQLSAGGSQRRAHGPVREATRKLRRPEITRFHMHRGLCRAPAPRLRQAPRFPSQRSERQHPSEWLEKAEDAPMEKKRRVNTTQEEQPAVLPPPATPRMRGAPNVSAQSAHPGVIAP
jgi:hypothetical protein